MFRLIGAILIISSTAAWGIFGVMKLRERSASLSSISQSLDIMQSELCSRLTPMPELFSTLTRTSAYPANVFYERLKKDINAIGETPFEEIWTNAVKNTPELMLTPQEALVLSKLGYSIGRYDLDEQKIAIEHTYGRMRQFAEKANTEMLRDSKVRAFTGVAAGIFTVIILM